MTVSLFGFRYKGVIFPKQGSSRLVLYSKNEKRVPASHYLPRMLAEPVFLNPKPYKPYKPKKPKTLNPKPINPKPTSYGLSRIRRVTRSPRGCESLQTTLRLQYASIEKYTLTLNYSRIPDMIYGIFLNEGILESLGLRHDPFCCSAAVLEEEMSVAPLAGGPRGLRFPKFSPYRFRA